jgi:hypothetical protein
MLMGKHIICLTDTTVLGRWILREVEAVFLSGHFPLINPSLAKMSSWQSEPFNARVSSDGGRENEGFNRGL